MARTTIFTGDDVIIRVQLLDRRRRAFEIRDTATVKAVLRQGREQVTDVITCVPTTSGADWDNSMVAVVVASEDTADIPPSRRTSVEVEVTPAGGGTTTWLASPVLVLEGTIT